MNLRELQPFQPVTQNGLMPSLDLVEIIQRLVRTVKDRDATIADYEARISALEAAMGNINTIDDIDGGTA